MDSYSSSIPARKGSYTESLNEAILIYQETIAKIAQEAAAVKLTLASTKNLGMHYRIQHPLAVRVEGFIKPKNFVPSDVMKDPRVVVAREHLVSAAQDALQELSYLLGLYNQEHMERSAASKREKRLLGAIARDYVSRDSLWESLATEGKDLGSLRKELIKAKREKLWAEAKRNSLIWAIKEISTDFAAGVRLIEDMKVSEEDGSFKGNFAFDTELRKMYGNFAQEINRIFDIQTRSGGAPEDASQPLRMIIGKIKRSQETAGSKADTVPHDALVREESTENFALYSLAPIMNRITDQEINFPLSALLPGNGSPKDRAAAINDAKPIADTVPYFELIENPKVGPITSGPIDPDSPGSVKIACYFVNKDGTRRYVNPLDLSTEADQPIKYEAVPHIQTLRHTQTHRNEYGQEQTTNIESSAMYLLRRPVAAASSSKRSLTPLSDSTGGQGSRMVAGIDAYAAPADAEKDESFEMSAGMVDPKAQKTRRITTKK